MEHVNKLREYGLFDAKVPRYTSYPPANRFELDTGARMQAPWLKALPHELPISVYIHIPFCRRLCWFCACRTQGTQTLQPVEAYLRDLMSEIAMVAQILGGRRKMARLHLGGGTPTLLSADQMGRLLDSVDQNFVRTEDCEFSVEIDPTEAAPEVLDLLADRQMRRASIGVQDFEPQVQEAIGRHQSFEETKAVLDRLRAGGVESLNIDLLYGLPFQTHRSLLATLDQVHALAPDRLALYGYAHVPHMSKRQAMIPGDALPTSLERFEAAHKAKQRLEAQGYLSVGIDHFARPDDSLAHAAAEGRLRRNFQGYTDDPCNVLLGFGASAISQFPQGYVQNCVATAAYQKQIREGRLSGHKGYCLTAEDAFISDIVDQVMCQGGIDTKRIARRHGPFAHELPRIFSDLKRTFPSAFDVSEGRLQFRPGMEALARVVAARVDAALMTDHIHSLAI